MKLPEKPPKSKKLIDLFEIALNNENFKEIYETTNKYAKDYLYWSELKFKIKGKNKRELVWALTKQQRKTTIQEINYKQIKLKYNNLNSFLKQLQEIDVNLAGSIEKRKIQFEEKYINSTLMEEAIASSKIEGASTTRKKAKQMLKEKKKPTTESEQMISNNYETMQFIVKKKNEKITPGLIAEIQKIITKGTLKDEEDEGTYRDNNEVRVEDGEGNLAHIPPKFEKIPKLIEEFCKYANNNDEEFIHPIIKGISIHFLLSYIHPFNDGNGRTSRSIFYWYMLSKGYKLFEFLTVSTEILNSRLDYDKAFIYTEYDDLDITYFIKYNLKCISSALQNMKRYLERKEKEKQIANKIIKEVPELNERQRNILAEFRKHKSKTFSIQEIKETEAIAYETARTDLEKLTALKLILKKQEDKKFIYQLK